MRHVCRLTVVTTLLALTLVPSIGVSQMSEGDAIARAMSCCQKEESWDAQVAKARAKTHAFPPKNPELGVDHEQVANASETTFSVSVTIPVSGERRLLRDAAAALADAESANVLLETRELIADVRHGFYEVVAGQARASVYESWLEEAASVETLIKQAVDAGETSKYDYERLKKEIAEVNRQYAAVNIARHKREIEFAQYLDLNELPMLKATLLPQDTSLTERREHPSINALHASKKSAELKVDASKRWWIPNPTLTGGYKWVQSDGSDHGFVIGLGIALPLFQQSRATREIYEAEQARLSSQLRIVERQIDARIDAATMEKRTLLNAAEVYQAEGVIRSQSLLELARTSYQNGEVGILALIDAERGVLESKLNFIELSAAARHADTELKFLTGVAP